MPEKVEDEEDIDAPQVAVMVAPPPINKQFVVPVNQHLMHTQSKDDIFKPKEHDHVRL